MLGCLISMCLCSKTACFSKNSATNAIVDRNSKLARWYKCGPKHDLKLRFCTDIYIFYTLCCFMIFACMYVQICKIKGVCSRKKTIILFQNNLPKRIVLIFLTFVVDEEKSARKPTQICQTLNKNPRKFYLIENPSIYRMIQFSTLYLSVRSTPPNYNDLPVFICCRPLLLPCW